MTSALVHDSRLHCWNLLLLLKAPHLINPIVFLTGLNYVLEANRHSCIDWQ
jgi:hypothetical protein